MVRHGDVEGDALHVLRRLRAADGAVVLGAAVGGADDQRLAEPHRAAPAACRAPPRSRAACRCRGRRSRRARSSASARRPSARRASGCRRSCGSSVDKKKARRSGGPWGWDWGGRGRRALPAPENKNGPPHGATGQSNREVQGRLAAPARAQLGRPVIRSREASELLQNCGAGASVTAPSRTAIGRLSPLVSRDARALLLDCTRSRGCNLQRTQNGRRPEHRSQRASRPHCRDRRGACRQQRRCGRRGRCADPVGLRHAARAGDGRAGGRRSS